MYGLWLQVLALPAQHQTEGRDHKRNMTNTIRKLTLYRQSQDTSPDALMGVIRNAMGANKSNLPTVGEGGSGPAEAVATGFPASGRQAMYQSASLTRSSMPIAPFVKGGALPDLCCLRLTGF